MASCLDARTGAIKGSGGSATALQLHRYWPRDGCIFQDEDSRTIVLRPGSGEPLAVNALDGATLASMAVAPKSRFIRTTTHLYRLAQL